MAIKQRKKAPATKVENYEIGNRSEWFLIGKFSLHEQKNKYCKPVNRRYVESWTENR